MWSFSLHRNFFFEVIYLHPINVAFTHMINISLNQHLQQTKRFYQSSSVTWAIPQSRDESVQLEHTVYIPLNSNQRPGSLTDGRRSHLKHRVFHRLYIVAVNFKLYITQ